VELLIDHKCRVLHVTLNRPEKRNALNAELCSGIVNAVRSAQERAEVGAILISAVGHVFCAGMDLDEAAAVEDDELAGIHEQLFTIGATSLKPIVVCVNGAALGGGLGLIAQGHIVITSQGAAFSLPEIRIGLWPFLVYRSVEAAMGARRTLELSLTGRVFHACDALQWGLVHQVCHGGEVVDRGQALARELAKASPTAVAAGMQYFHESRGKSWKEAGEVASRLRGDVMRSADFHEGYEAFKHKREPRWPSMPSNAYAENKKRPPEDNPPQEKRGPEASK
jgi:enoyl-CoA hydratase/carnithine racemase